jgi:threonine/homoserine/homoserine lactone efflux protein
MKRRAILMVAAVVGSSLLLNSLPWWLRYIALAAVAIGLYVIWTVPTLPDDAPRAPRTIVE